MVFTICAKQEYADFALHVECRLSPRSNSGIGIRTVPYDPKKDKETRPSYHSYEIQVQDDEGKPPDKNSTGSLYRYVAPMANPIKRAPAWNTLDVECIGPRIRITVNGQEVLNVDQSTIAAIKDKPLKGYVCLQSHTPPKGVESKIEFRNVRIREIEWRVSKNGLLPQFDFQALYRMNGVGQDLGSMLTQLSTATYADWSLGGSFSMPDRNVPSAVRVPT